MSAEPVAARAARLAEAVRRLGDGRWHEDAARLAGEQPPARRHEAPPTFGEVARRGTSVVEGLVEEGRWDEAAVQARHLHAFFAREGGHLGPVAAPTFDGLLAAVLARDHDEVADFMALTGELFP